MTRALRSAKVRGVDAVGTEECRLCAQTPSAARRPASFASAIARVPCVRSCAGRVQQVPLGPACRRRCPCRSVSPARRNQVAVVLVHSPHGPAVLFPERETHGPSRRRHGRCGRRRQAPDGVRLSGRETRSRSPAPPAPREICAAPASPAKLKSNASCELAVR